MHRYSVPMGQGTRKKGYVYLWVIKIGFKNVVDLWQAHQHFMCLHKNIKISNLWRPFTDACRRHVSQVYYSQVVSFNMTSLAGSCA